MNLWTDLCRIIVVILLVTDTCKAASQFANFSNDRAPTGMVSNQFIVSPVNNDGPMIEAPMIGASSSGFPIAQSDFGQNITNYGQQFEQQSGQQSGQQMNMFEQPQLINSASFAQVEQPMLMNAPVQQLAPQSNSAQFSPLSMQSEQFNVQNPVPFNSPMSMPSNPMPFDPQQVGIAYSGPPMADMTSIQPQDSGSALPAGDQGATDQQPQETLITTASGFTIHISSFTQHSGSNLYQTQDWNKDQFFYSVNATLQIQFEKMTMLESPKLGITQYSISMPVALKFDPSSQITLAPMVDAAYIILQFLNNQGVPVFNFQMGGAYSADDQIAETASNIMVGSAVGAMQQLFNPTTGCVLSNYLNTPGNANKFVAIIEVGQLVDDLSQWMSEKKLSFLNFLLLPFKSMQFGISFCPNSQSVGSAAPSKEVNIMMYQTNWARPNLMGIDYTPEQISEAIYNETQDISYAGFSRNSISFAGHWNYSLSQDINLTFSLGMVCAEAAIGCPNAETMMVEEILYENAPWWKPITDSISRRYTGEGMSKLEDLNTMKSPKNSSEKQICLIPSITEHNVFGYKGCIILDIKNVAEIAFSYLDNTNSFLNTKLTGDAGKSIEGCMVLNCVDFKIGGLVTYSWRKIAMVSKETNNAKFQALSGSVGIQFNLRGFDVSASLVYIKTWNNATSASTDDVDLSIWPQSVYPSVNKPSCGFGFNITIQKST